jgi:hypothetical protein
VRRSSPSRHEWQNRTKEQIINNANANPRGLQEHNERERKDEMDVEWQWWQQPAERERVVAKKPSSVSAYSSSVVPTRPPRTKVAISNQQQMRGPPFGRLEEAMDIARLHRLVDDLDLQSLCCLRLASKSLGKIAARILTRRVPQMELVLAPFTDGFAVLGHSRFSRNRLRRVLKEERETTIHFEHGRPVEYVRCGEFPLQRTAESNFYTAPKLAFQWSCEELLLVNLDRMFGGIAFREYRGQKLCLFWKPTGADALLQGGVVKIAEVWIEASPQAGKRVCDIHHSSLEFHVLQSQTREGNDILVEYEGSVGAVNFRLDLRTLTEA